MTQRFTPGQKVFTILIHQPEKTNRPGRAQIHFCNYVHRRGSWHRYRNLRSGAEWNENGLSWFGTEKQAIEQFMTCMIESLHYHHDPVKFNSPEVSYILDVLDQYIKAKNPVRRQEDP